MFISGTSNWTEDYFSDSAGISLTIEVADGGATVSKTLLAELESIFQRDWHSKLSVPLN